MTDSKSVTQLFQNKLIPPPLPKACDFVVQLIFTIAHNPGKMNTAADFLSRLDIDPNQKLIVKIRGVMPTLPIEVNIQSTGKTQEDRVFFLIEDANLPSEQQQWQRKQEKRNAVHTEPHVKTATQMKTARTH